MQLLSEQQPSVQSFQRSRLLYSAVVFLQITRGQSYTLGILPDLGGYNRQLVLNRHKWRLPLWRRALVSCSATRRNGTRKPEWNTETSPFDILRYHLSNETSDQTINELVKTYSIENLQQLVENAPKFLPYHIEGTFSGLAVDIVSALMKVKKQPEDELGGSVVFDPKCINEKPLRLFSEQAVSVEPTDFDNLPFPMPRIPDFTFVLGSSGSGKTVFALNRLPELLCPGAISRNESLRIHLTADSVVGATSTKKSVSSLAAAFVKETIADLLSSPLVNPSIDLLLHVVIDEAGGDTNKVFFNSAAKIQNIVNALKRMKTYKFKRVHVTVVGTALETTTQDIVSYVETVKFRMQPWLPKNFNAFVEISGRSDAKLVKEIVSRFPILQDLTTNARCAYFLVESMPNVRVQNSKRWSKYVDVLVSNVARLYSSMNGLSILTSDSQKLQVARAAFHALNDASSKPGVAFFPTFSDLDDIALRSVAQSLLDIPVEIRGEVHIILGRDRYSVSISPAIAIVLAELIDENANIAWDRKGFESTAALGEWKKITMETQETSLSNLCGIVYLRSPCPASGATKRLVDCTTGQAKIAGQTSHEEDKKKMNRRKTTYKVPVVSSSTVLLNGPNAEYADVIAPYRMLQMKFSKDAAKTQRLDFDTELNKMGLTVSPLYRVQQAFTSILYRSWPQQHQSRADAYERLERLTFSASSRSEHYPYQDMISGSESTHEEIEFYLDGNHVLPVSNEPPSPIWSKPLEILERFTDSQPVTALFVTNCNSFVLLKEGKANITVTRKDSNWQGILEKPLPDYLLSGLRENVLVRFLFY